MLFSGASSVTWQPPPDTPPSLPLVVSVNASFERLLGSWYLITVTANPDKVDEAIKACQVTAKIPTGLLCLLPLCVRYVG